MCLAAEYTLERRHGSRLEIMSVFLKYFVCRHDRGGNQLALSSLNNCEHKLALFAVKVIRSFVIKVCLQAFHAPNFVF